MKHLKLYETFPEVMSDPTFANDIFKVKYKPNSDLSNKKGNDTIDKPINDVLDEFAVGDFVTGTGVDDKEEHTGPVLRIEKDSKGENTEIYIEEDGEEVRLLPSTVRMEEEVGNSKFAPVKDTNPDMVDPIPGGTAYENQGSSVTKQKGNMNNIKSFELFESDNTQPSDLKALKKMMRKVSTTRGPYYDYFATPNNHGKFQFAQNEEIWNKNGIMSYNGSGNPEMYIKTANEFLNPLGWTMTDKGGRSVVITKLS